MCKFFQENMETVTYAAVRQAMDGEPFDMSLVGQDSREVEDAVNIGIDAHLEACFVPSLGDSYEREERKTKDGVVHTVALSCVVSPESLPVLLRRLFEADPCSSLASSILTCLGFDDSGEYVGREE